MGKYNKATEILKTKLVYKNITTQLSKVNLKFQYKLLKTGARSSLYEYAIEWLNLAGISKQLFRISHISIPLKSNVVESDFKLFMSDVGLLCASQEIDFDDIVMDVLNSNFKGGLTENYVYNQLMINNVSAYYWTSNSDAKIDFITRIDNDIISIEVKSSDNVRAKSLSVYIKEFKPKYAIRISQKNFGFENNIKSIPLYATYLVK